MKMYRGALMCLYMVLGTFKLRFYLFVIPQ